MTKKLITATLSEQQENFIKAYAESNDIQLALKESGMTKSNFNRDSVKDTPFGIQFRALMNDTLKRYEFSKVASLDDLVKIREESMKDPETYPLAISAIKEIAKMMDDHLAVQKRVEEKTNINVEAVIDFTKKPKQIKHEEETQYIEI